MREPVRENVDRFENGSIDPKIDTAMDLIPPRALLAAGKTLFDGLKYEADKKDNWHGIPGGRHLNHALRHIAMYQAGDRDEDHLGHALVRLMFWVDLEIQVDPDAGH